MENDYKVNRIRKYFFHQLCATLGTTGACAFDKLTEIGPICKKKMGFFYETLS